MSTKHGCIKNCPPTYIMLIRGLGFTTLFYTWIKTCMKLNFSLIVKIHSGESPEHAGLHWATWGKEGIDPCPMCVDVLSSAWPAIDSRCWVWERVRPLRHLYYNKQCVAHFIYNIHTRHHPDGNLIKNPYTMIKLKKRILSRACSTEETRSVPWKRTPPYGDNKGSFWGNQITTIQFFYGIIH